MGYKKSKPGVEAGRSTLVCNDQIWDKALLGATQVYREKSIEKDLIRDRQTLLVYRQVQCTIGTSYVNIVKLRRYLLQKYTIYTEFNSLFR